MLKFNGSEPESYSFKRISEEETQKVLRLWETEQQIQQEQHDKEAAMPTVHDVSETLSVPEEDVIRLLEKVRNEKLPDPSDLPAEPTIEIPAAPVKGSDNSPIYINSQLTKRNTVTDSSATVNDTPLESQGVVADKNTALKSIGKPLVMAAVVLGIIVSIGYLIRRIRDGHHWPPSYSSQNSFTKQGYAIIDGQKVLIPLNSGSSHPSFQYAMMNSFSYTSLCKANDLNLQKAILNQDKGKITQALSTIVSTESSFALWSIDDPLIADSVDASQDETLSIKRAAGRRKFGFDRTTPLQYAQLHDLKKSFMLLVRAGANINQITYNDEMSPIVKGSIPQVASTPLIEAVNQNNVEWIRFLLANGASVYVPKLNTLPTIASSNGIAITSHPKQALEIAAVQGKTDICRILLEHEKLVNEDNIVSFERARALAIKHHQRSAAELFKKQEKELLSRNIPSK